ncbi:asparagine synthetase [glutamine-hydrolyzing]-like [Argopecten irradians]|uniref:asparagine synthetase [glutamine-hydrolyzing]-like n=1 Tax=Argopecten irradians TaxID=31199 RepID=UPI00371B4C04
MMGRGVKPSEYLNSGNKFIAGIVTEKSMCGIWGTFGCASDVLSLCKLALKIAHRGPDAFRLETIYQFPSCLLGFHRLAGVAANSDMQPIRVPQHPHIWLICDGKIYNHSNLKNKFDLHYTTQCDGEAIIHLYNRGGIEFAARHLDGVFAFCLFDTEKRKVYLGRDTFGVKPLYRVIKKDGSLSICSEVKGLMDIVANTSKDKIYHVSPGHVETYQLNNQYQVSLETIELFHNVGAVPIHTPTVTSSANDTKTIIRTLLERAVKKRMTSGQHIGCLLSGGLDSSLMTALVVKQSKEQGLPFPVRTFSVGMEASPDVVAARKVAKYLNTEHHEILFTAEEATAAIENVIYYVESYDDVTIRGSIGMYLLCKYVKEKTDTTLILSGEGADEILQGYKYFHEVPSPEAGDKESRRLCKDLSMFDIQRLDRISALSGEGADEILQGYKYFHEVPSPEAGDKESRRLCKDLSMFDIQRLDRISALFGLEVRLPYLDHCFTGYYLSLDPALRVPQNGIEKHFMRSVIEGTKLIPREIVWRRKQPFNECLTINTRTLDEIIEEFAGEKISDSDFDQCKQHYPHNPPFNKESQYYRQVFERFYPGQDHLTPYYWVPNWAFEDF